ncbi:MAG: Spx/MgsR family RNA polymerase-binding regulatory protein [Verrucomicrobiota bacterium]
MSWKLYGYAKCSTCGKAKKWLEARGVDFEEIPIRETPPSVAELRVGLVAAAGNWRKITNTSSQDYRDGWKATFSQASEAEILEALSTHGNLVKRPFVIQGKTALSGFRPAEWEAVF